MSSEYYKQKQTIGFWTERAFFHFKFNAMQNTLSLL